MKNLKKLLSMILVLALLMADFGLAQEMMVADSGDLSAIEELLADSGLELTGEMIEENGEVKFAVEAIDVEEEPIAEESAMELLPIEEIEDMPAEEEAPAENPEMSVPEAADSEKNEAEIEASEIAAPETEAADEETMGEIIVDQKLAPPAECPECGAVGQSHVAYNDECHWWVCDNCDACITEDEGHYSACTDGNDTEECDVCHAWGNGEYGAYIYITHEVAVDTPFVTNAKEHWQICALCGGKADAGSHYISCKDPDATQCELCGYAASEFEIAHDDIDFDSYAATAEGHGYRCNDCGEIVDFSAHEIYCYVSTTHCAYCDYEVNPDDPNVEVCHSPEDTYTWDADTHYTACAYCGATISDKHWASCTDDVCGDCGASVEEINVNFDHSNLNIEYSDDAHWYVCNDCGEKKYVGEHWAYCDDTHTCAQCGRYSKTAYLNIEHEFDWGNYTEITATLHAVECMNCGKQEKFHHYKMCTDTDGDTCAECGASGVKLQLAHGECEYQIADRYHASYCIDCGEIMYAEYHYGSCTNPLKCVVCGYAISAPTDEDSLSHNYVLTNKGAAGHTYTCSDCGKTELTDHWANCDTPNTCFECGYVGKNLPVSHFCVDCTWDADHHYADCAVCGEKDIFADYGEHYAYCYNADACWTCEAPADEINLLIKHQYVDGVCIYCGAVRTGIASILMPETIELGVGEKLNLDLQIDPADAEGSVSYTFSKSGYVTLNADTLLLTAKKRGTVQLTATADNGVSAEASVTVKKAPSKVTLSSKAVTMGAGDRYTLSATLPADSASQLSWSSNAANVASVDEAGRITAGEPGKATITVKTFNGKKATCTVTVVAAPDSVVIDHTDAASVGQTISLKTVLKSGKTTLASEGYTYSCEPAGSVEFIGDSAKLLQAGEVTLIATAYNGCEGRSTLNVQPAPDQLILNDAGEIEKEIILGVGEKMSFVPAAANGSVFDVEFINEDAAIATVSGNESKFTIAGKKVGETTITVQPHLGEAAILHVTVMKAPSKLTMSSKKLTLGVDETAQLSVSFPSGSYSNLTWKSSKTSVVAVDADGNLKAIKAGSATITATAFNNKKASCTVTVKKAPTGLSLSCGVADGVLSVGQSATLKVALSSGSAGSYAYSVDPASVGQVSFNENKLTAEQPGEVTVIATAYNGVFDVLTLNIQPAPDQAVLDADGAIETEITLGVGEKITLKPGILNGSKADFSYTSENSKIATVSAAGLITAKKAGQTIVTVQPHLGEAAVVTVNVAAAPKSVSLSSKKMTLGVGETAQLIATLKNTGAASALTWKSSKPAVVAVDENGNLKAIKAGSSTITVTTFNKKKATCTVTVKAAPTALDLSINADVISMGQTAKLTAALSPAKCADGVEYNLSVEGIAAISGTTVTPIQPGEVTITASTYNGLSDSVTLQVKEAPDQLVIAETDIELGVGEKYELKPAAANGSPVTISYKAKNSKVATVSAAGLITGKKAGTTTITLTPHAGEGVVVNVIVLAAPKSLSLSASELKLNIGDEATLEAILPSKTASKITWVSNNEEAVKVDAQGKLTAVGEGVATITAKTFNGRTAKCTVSVEGLPQAQNFSAAYAGEGTANFSWEAVENADGYQLLVYLNEEWVVLKETEALSAQISGMADGQYQMAVRAYMNRDGKMVYGKNAIANLIVADELKIQSLEASASRLQPGKAAAWTVEAEGGLLPYAYAFDLYKDGALLKAGEAGESNRFECVLEEEGIYSVIVRVIDCVGNEASAESDALNVVEQPYYFETKKIEADQVEIIGVLLTNRFDGNLTVPSILDGKTVAGVGAGAFSSTAELVNVIIEDGVGYIGAEAFSGCTALESVRFPENVTEIAEGMFADCTALEQFDIPENVTSIGKHAFRGCRALEEIHIPAGVNSISAEAFSRLSKQDSLVVYVIYATPAYEALKNADLNVSVEDSPFEYTFTTNGVMITGARGVSGVLEIPAMLEGLEVTCIAVNAFSNTNEITAVSFPETIESIGESAFRCCENLKTVRIPGNCESVFNQAFADCSNLRSLELENGIQRIYSDAFINCTSLEEVTIPASCTLLGGGAFAYCFQLKKLTILSKDADFDDGHLLDESRLAVVYCYTGSTAEAFCKGEWGDGYPESVPYTLIDGDVTYYGVMDIALEGDTAKLVGDTQAWSIYAVGYEDCREFRYDLYRDGEVVFSSEWTQETRFEYTFTEAGDYALTATMRINGDDATAKLFDESERLYIGQMAEGTPFSYMLQDEGVRICGYMDEMPEYLEIPATLNVEVDGEMRALLVIGIGSYAFANQENLRGVSIPDGVEYIMSGAFEGSALESVDLPDSVNQLGYGAFAECGNLERVTLGSGIVEIAPEAFMNCHNLREINLSAVKYIGDNGFDCCCNLKEIQIDSLEDMGRSVFANCGSLRSVHILGSLKCISESAFENCYNLLEVRMDEGVQYIEDSAFAGCGSMRELQLPTSLMRIGDWAFSEAGNLGEVDFTALDVEFGRGAFSDSGITMIVNKDSAAHDHAREWYLDYIVVGEASEDGLMYDLVWDGDEAIGAAVVGYDCDQTGSDLEGTLVIPASVEIDGVEYPVIEIGGYAIAEFENLHEVVLPDTIRVLRETAFYGNWNLRKINLPEGLERIEADAFYGCEKLEEITIPSSCTFLGGGAFAYCLQLKKLTILSKDADFDDGHLLDESSLVVVYCYADSTAEAFCKGEWGDGYPESVPYTLIDGDVEYYGVMDISIYKYADSVNNTAIWDVYAVGYEGSREFRYDLYNHGELLFSSEWTEETRFEYTFEMDGDYQLGVVMRINGDEATATEVFKDDEILSIVIYSDTTPFAYMFDGEGVRICGYNGNIPEYLEIPETLEVEVDGEMRSLPVVTIGANAFADYNYLLRGVTIPNSVQRIMCNAFANTYLESVVIPDSVTTLDYGAFAWCLELESVVIGSGITEIPYECFSDCEDLISVSLPEGLKEIGDAAFRWCRLSEIQLPEGLERVGAQAFLETNLDEIVIPDSVVEIGDEAFLMNWSRSVKLGSGLRRIGNDAFSECDISSINLEDTALETLGAYAFRSCSSLESIRLPDTLTEMGNGAFCGCTGLESVVVGSGLTELPENSFEECYNLRSITLPDNLERIGGWCFKNCCRMQSLTIPESVTSIGDYAFEDCYGFIDGLVIPESVVDFGEDVFCNNGSDLYVVLGSAAHDYVREWGYNYVVIGEADSGLLRYNVIDDCIEIAYYDDVIEGELVIPAEIDGMPVVSIADGAFQGQDRMTRVVLPESLTYIGSDAFSGCGRLTSVDLPDGLETIGEAAFAYCDRLEKLQIPTSVNEIGDRLIEDSRRCVLYVQIGSAAEEYAIAHNLPYDNGDSASFRVLKVEVVHWTDVVYDSAAWRAFVSGAEDGMEYNYRLYKDGELFEDFGWSTQSTVSFEFYVGGDYTMELAVRKANGETSDYVMGEDTMIIGEEWGGFRYNYVGENEIKITSITECEGDLVIPESLWSSTVKVVGIADHCFIGREDITGVTLPRTLRSIGADAFGDCSNLTFVDFGENSQLESIGSYAFANCDALTEIVLPSGVTSIGEGMFDDCNSLESVHFADGISEIPAYLFRNCGSLREVKLPAKLNRIDTEAFIWSGIEEIILPDGVEKIEERAFEGSALRSINIPDGVVRLQYRSFADCDKLESVSLGSGVIEIGSEAFINCHNLREINLSGVKFIGDYGFDCCCSMEEIQIDSMEDMGRGVFANCGSLRSVHIPGSLTWISESVFENCGGLQEVRMDEGVQYIEVNAFAGCGSLRELQLPSSLKNIADWAFSDTGSLGEVDFTALDVEFGEGAFNNSGVCMLVNMDSSAYFYAMENYLNYRLMDGAEADANALCFEIRGEEGEEYAVLVAYDGEPVGDLVIPESYEVDGVVYPVVGLDDGCLNNGTNIMSVTIPASVEFIGNEAFFNCWRMRSVQLETGEKARAAGCSLTSIGADAFAYCSSLNSINLGDAENLQTISRNAFANCTSLESLTIPASVETMEEDAVSGNPYVILNVAPGSAGEQYAKEAGLAYDNGSGIALTVQEVVVEQYAEAPDQSASWRTHWVGGEGDVSFSYYLYRGGESYETLAENTAEEWIEYTFCENGVYTLEVIAADAAGNRSSKMSSDCVMISEYDESSGFSYSIESIADRTLWIIGCSEDVEGDVVIPAELTIGDTVYAVTTVSSFGGNHNITSLTLSEGIRSIDYECFAEMENLVEVSLPASLEGIADRAFENCRQLQSIQIRSAEYIGSEAFYDCASLERIVSGLPSNLQAIYDNAFAGCNALCMDGSSLPDGLNYVGNYAFADCFNLGTLNISENLTDLGEDVFCNSGVIIRANVGAYILQYALEYGYEFIAVGEADSGALSYNVKDGGAIITGYNGFVFGDLVIPAEVGDGLPVTGIEFGAFAGQSGIMQLTIPASVETIGEEAFAGCYHMRVTFEGEGLKTIGREAFAGCRDIGNVYLPASVETIGYRAFADSEYLCEIEIGANVTNMGADIFQDSPRVSLLVEAGSTAHTYAIAHNLPYNTGSGYALTVQYVQINEWDGSEDREAMAEVAAMGGTDDYLYQYQMYRNGQAYGAESEWTADNWYAIEFTESGRYQLFARVKDTNGTISQYKASEAMDVSEFDAETAFYYAAISDTEVAILGMQDPSGEVTIPEMLGGKAVVEIANRAFEGCEQLESVILPEGLREIDSHAFQDCCNLRSVNFPASLEKIGVSAFLRTAIENASLPDGLESLGDGAFAYNTNLSSVILPADLKEISNSLFAGCESLSAVEIPSGVNQIGMCAFFECKSLEEIILPAGVKSIPYYAFHNCGLKRVELNSGLESIDQSAFNGNGALESIAIPSSVKTLGDYAFLNCDALVDVQLPEGLESIGVGCFMNAISLQMLVIPASVNSIGVHGDNVHAFECTHESFKLILTEGSYAQEYADRFGIPYLMESNVIGDFTYGYNADYTGVVIQKYSGSEASVIVPESLNDMPVVAIGEGAFENNSSLTAVDLPDTIEVIGTRAFANCEKLSSMT